LTGTVTVVGAVGTVFTAVPFVLSWQPSERARALGAPVQVDIGKLEPGSRVIVKWQGKPVWIVRRTRDVLEELPAHDGQLRDPSSNESIQPAYARNEVRALKPEYLVLVGICTHLGCSPQYVRAGQGGQFNLPAGWRGFFCPCHGSKFDLAGRVYQGVPAPTNLTVPPYRFISDSLVEIGADATQGAA